MTEPQMARIQAEGIPWRKAGGTPRWGTWWLEPGASSALVLVSQHGNMEQHSIHDRNMFSPWNFGSTESIQNLSQQSQIKRDQTWSKQLMSWKWCGMVWSIGPWWSLGPPGSAALSEALQVIQGCCEYGHYLGRWAESQWSWPKIRDWTIIEWGWMGIEMMNKWATFNMTWANYSNLCSPEPWNHG